MPRRMHRRGAIARGGRGLRKPCRLAWPNGCPTGTAPWQSRCPRRTGSEPVRRGHLLNSILITGRRWGGRRQGAGGGVGAQVGAQGGAGWGAGGGARAQAGGMGARAGAVVWVRPRWRRRPRPRDPRGPRGREPGDNAPRGRERLRAAALLGTMITDQFANGNPGSPLGPAPNCVVSAAFVRSLSSKQTIE